MEKKSIMNIAWAATGHTPFDDAVKRTRDALAQQGFGVLTEIDIKATLKAKLGEDVEDYLILGACSPPLAHRAVNVDRQIGLLLPCSVVVRTDGADESTALVDAMNPQLLVDVTGEPELRPVADEVTTKLRAAINSMGRLLSPSGGESPAISRMLGAFSDTEAITSGAGAFATLLTEFLPLAADRRSHPGDDLV